jgi:lanthanide-dependent methanol dehydrogenase
MARNVCPAAPGMKDWQPSAYSPRTGWLYIPKNHLCMDYEGVEANYIAGTPYVGANVVMYGAPDDYRGEFIAWDPVGRGRVWEIRRAVPGVERRARDGRRCRLLRHHGPLVQGRARGDGRGAVAVPDGLRHHRPAGHVPRAGRHGSTSRSCPASAAGPARRTRHSCPTRTRTIALGFAHAVRDLPDYTPEGGAVYVFALPEAGGARTPAGGPLATAAADS